MRQILNLVQYGSMHTISACMGSSYAIPVSQGCAASSTQKLEMVLCAETKPHFAEVLAIAVSGREMLVQAEGSSRVEAVVAAAEQWQEDLRQVVALKKERQRLSRCMRAMGGTLDLALQQLERHVQVCLSICQL